MTFTFKLTDPLGWKFLYLVSISAQLALPAWASAQTLPDAGILQQQIDRGRQQALPPPALPSQAGRPTEAKPPQGVTLEVKRFKFAGNSLLPDQTLAAAVAGFLNRPIDFAQLQDAAAAAANRYRDAGWVVRAYIPEQDFVDGQVTIQIVEAVFGKLVQDGPASARVPAGLIERIVGAQLKPGDRIKTDAIDRAILLANDLAGITATGSLQEGSQDSQSDLLVKTVDLAVLQGDASLDNLGSRSTGSQRVSANLSANSLLNRGELLTANAIATAGSKYLRLAAAMPLGGDGLRLGLNASRLNYRVILPEFSEIDPYGSSTAYGLDARYPIIRSRLKNLYLNLAVDRKRYANFGAGSPSTVYANRSITWGLSGNTYDEWIGGGTNSANLSFTSGQIDLNGSPNQDADANTTQTAGSYRKLRYALSRQQILTKSFSLAVAWSGQWAAKNLDSSEKFLLGGSSGIRAYPSGEGSGTSGSMANVDLSWQLPAGFGLTGFYDIGVIKINADNNYPGASALNGYRLAGAGLTLSRQLQAGFNVKATWARRIGDNPNPTATGKDQDGSLQRNRVWLIANLAF